MHSAPRDISSEGSPRDDESEASPDKASEPKSIRDPPHACTASVVGFSILFFFDERRRRNNHPEIVKTVLGIFVFSIWIDAMNGKSMIAAEFPRLIPDRRNGSRVHLGGKLARVFWLFRSCGKIGEVSHRRRKMNDD